MHQYFISLFKLRTRPSWIKRWMYQMVISPCHQRYTYTRFSSPTPFHKFIPRDRKIEPSPFSNSWPLIGISLDARSIDIFLFFYEFCLINFINFIIFLLSDIAFQFRKRAAFYHGVDEHPSDNSITKVLF